MWKPACAYLGAARVCDRGLAGQVMLLWLLCVRWCVTVWLWPCIGEKCHAVQNDSGPPLIEWAKGVKAMTLCVQDTLP